MCLDLVKELSALCLRILGKDNAFGILGLLGVALEAVSQQTL